MDQERLRKLRRSVTKAVISERKSLKRVRADVFSLLGNTAKGIDEDGGLQDAGNDLKTHSAKLQRLQKLSAEVGKASKRRAKVTEPMCYLEASNTTDPDDVIRAYFVRNQATVPGINFISPESQIGEELYNPKRPEKTKRAGDVFTIAGGTYRITVVE
ncbi:hypothetical protein HY440_01875 [Candidatus Microgenomates bacterium]|nr:hypothetical protein [Candidatus Microgenomates bacterium]